MSKRELKNLGINPGKANEHEDLGPRTTRSRQPPPTPTEKINQKKRGGYKDPEDSNKAAGGEELPEQNKKSGRKIAPRRRKKEQREDASEGEEQAAVDQKAEQRLRDREAMEEVKREKKKEEKEAREKEAEQVAEEKRKKREEKEQEKAAEEEQGRTKEAEQVAEEKRKKREEKEQEKAAEEEQGRTKEAEQVAEEKRKKREAKEQEKAAEEEQGRTKEAERVAAAEKAAEEMQRDQARERLKEQLDDRGKEQAAKKTRKKSEQDDGRKPKRKKGDDKDWDPLPPASDQLKQLRGTLIHPLTRFEFARMGTTTCAGCETYIANGHNSEFPVRMDCCKGIAGRMCIERAIQFQLDEDPRREAVMCPLPGCRTEFPPTKDQHKSKPTTAEDQHEPNEDQTTPPKPTTTRNQPFDPATTDSYKKHKDQREFYHDLRKIEIFKKRTLVDYTSEPPNGYVVSQDRAKGAEKNTFIYKQVIGGFKHGRGHQLLLRSPSANKSCPDNHCYDLEAQMHHAVNKFTLLTAQSIRGLENVFVNGLSTGNATAQNRVFLVGVASVKQNLLRLSNEENEIMETIPQQTPLTRLLFVGRTFPGTWFNQSAVGGKFGTMATRRLIADFRTKSGQDPQTLPPPKAERRIIPVKIISKGTKKKMNGDGDEKDPEER